jgi:hypothetical protein
MLHIAEDFRMKFVPTPQDYLKHLDVQPWMCNGVKDLVSKEGSELVEKLNQKLKDES